MVNNNQLSNENTKPSATIKDLAKAAGVSVGTISKVLSGSPKSSRISAVTAKRVIKCARELGYRPNVNARALARQRAQTLGVYVAPHVGARINALYISPILEGICAAAREKHHDVMLIDFGCTEAQPHHIEEQFRSKRVDGVILVNFRGNPDLLQKLIATRVPLSAVDNYEYSISSVNLDNACGISAVVQHLYGLGHRQLAFLGELSDSTMMDHTLRRDAFVHATRQLKIESQCSVISHEQTELRVPRDGPFCQEDGYRGVDLLLTSGRPFTALVCYNDLVAMGAMRRLAEAHLRIPDDVSIAGFDNSMLSAHLFPPLTTVEHPTREMGIHAVDMVLEAIEHPDDGRAGRTLMLRPELVIRQSTSVCLRSIGR
jgi:DNA-binding LacI/PurR family transcriptional regulator